MRLHALLSFYDEPPEALAQTLIGLKDLGCDHVIAVDGRYQRFPGNEYLSLPEAHAMILRACSSLRLACTLHLPSGPWEGDEVAKRTHVFALAVAQADLDDWLVSIDADEAFVQGPPDLKERLAATEHDVAIAAVHDVNVAMLRERQPELVGSFPERIAQRRFFRAQPIYVDTNHHTYRTYDGDRALWTSMGEEHEPEPALDLSAHVVLEHRPFVRPEGRQRDKMIYYNEGRQEHGRCEWVTKDLQCVAEAVERSVYDVKLVDGQPRAKRGELCETHVRRGRERVARRLRTWKYLCSCTVAQRDSDGVCTSCGRPTSMDRLGRWVEGHDVPASA